MSAELTALDCKPWGKATIREVIDAPLHGGERGMLRLTVAGLLVLILGQKLAFPPTIELSFYTSFALAIVLLLWRKGAIDPARMLGYVASMAVCILVTVTSPLHPAFSITAIMYLVIIHMPFMLVVPVRRTFYLKLLRIFMMIGMVVATLVYVQWAQQLVGMRMINLEDYIPKPFLYVGYNYIQKLDYFSQYYKPNAFLMLETSHTSQTLAIATLIELCLFRRMLIVAYMLIAQLVTFGGTGMLLIVVTIPFVLRYLSLRLVLTGMIIFPIALIVAAQVGVLDNALGRSAEFDKPGTSGNGRFVNHFVIAAKSASLDADHALFGIGAGQVSPFVNDSTTVFLPLSKLTVEYGLPAALLFFAWMTYCFFTAGVPMVVTWPLLILFNLIGGTLLIPINTYYCLFLTAMFVPNRATAFTQARLFRRDRLPRIASHVIAGEASETR
ncbi:hypothetical protein [Sphingomonas sp. PP-CC-3A-396]|uniref:hypothetical protein n=1 Tax=Sphingomonas sp. PP-CC-3A-396 TaxID=2135655 RepID=UPI0010517C6E|nr:hypothetical protein [Sphingomonas sp. PP-CC-3A-396]